MKKSIFGLMACALLASCATHQQVTRVESQVKPIEQDLNKPQGLKRKVAIGRFSNETQYAKGIFYNKENDPIGKQAVDILSSKLASTNKFILLERADTQKIEDEMKLAGADVLKKIGADYVIIGSVNEFGRKTTGQVGVFSDSKTQVVQAGVSLRLVDVSTGQIIYSEEAKGEAETTNKSVLGLGSKADYDATLADKAISSALSKLVENVINNCTNRPWKSYFLNYDDNGILISGGKNQGLKIGDMFDVYEKGKSINNPQTGMMVELPGKKVAKIKVDNLVGETAQNEFSMVSFVDGSINKQNLSNYIIKEIK